MVFYAFFIYKDGGINLFAQPDKKSLDKEVKEMLDDIKADKDLLPKIIRFSGDVFTVWSGELLWRIVKKSVDAQM